MPRTNVNRVKTKYRRFNDWLRGEMKRRKVRQAELAEYLNIEQATLSKRMNGEIEWLFVDVLEVLEYFNASFEEVF
jgi:transcriptional regulator with XRE-family HTH domain